MNLLPEKSKKAWTGTFRPSKTLAANLAATATGSQRYMNVTPTCPDGYYVVSMELPTSDGIDGLSTRNVTATVFANTKQGKNITADLDAPEGAPHRINIENGKYDGQFQGDFYDVPLPHAYSTSFTTPKGEVVEIPYVDEVSVFVFDGDSLKKAFSKAIKRIEEDDNYVKLEAKQTDQTDADKLAAHLANNQ